VRGVGDGAVALSIAGAASLASVLGVISLTTGGDLAVFFAPHGARVESVVAHTLRDAVLAGAIAALAGFAVGRACVRASCWLRALEHRAVMWGGLALGAVAGGVGATIEFGVFDVSLGAVRQPPAALQTGLAAGLAVGILLFVIGYLLRRRRAEDDGFRL
jgi:hypothetical protein